MRVSPFGRSERLLHHDVSAMDSETLALTSAVVFARPSAVLLRRG